MDEDWSNVSFEDFKEETDVKFGSDASNKRNFPEEEEDQGQSKKFKATYIDTDKYDEQQQKIEQLNTQLAELTSKLAVAQICDRCDKCKKNSAGAQKNPETALTATAVNAAENLTVPGHKDDTLATATEVDTSQSSASAVVNDSQANDGGNVSE